MQIEPATTTSINLSLSHGPGAPIFDQNGPHTRIRRAPVRAIGAMQVNGKEIYGKVVDISSGGCLFKTETTLNEGDVFSLRITILDGSKRIVAKVNGKIKRVCSTPNERPSYGCEFSSNNIEERRVQNWLYSKAIA